MERYLTEAQKGLQKMSLSIKALMFSANPFKAPPRASDTLLNLLQDAIKIMMFQASDQRVQVSFHPPPEFGRDAVGGRPLLRLHQYHQECPAGHAPGR